MSGMGGVGVGLVYVQGGGAARVRSIFSGRAASTARPEMFDKFLAWRRAACAARAGKTCRAGSQCTARTGACPLDQLFKEAIDYAANGYPITPMNAEVIKGTFRKACRSWLVFRRAGLPR